jgi:methylated-DNA-[protein]-cysteine S-methyltransferase
VRRVEFGPLPKDAHADPPEAWPPALASAVGQLQEYFRGKRSVFEVELDLETVTDFQREVYTRLLEVGHGRITTYGELAESVNRAELARAVGQAVGANPIPIFIPCHRVVAADSRLGGFSGGLAAKAALLRIENVDVEGETESSRIHPEVLRLDL